MHLVHFTPALLLALACSGSALPATNFKITASDAILEAQPQYEIRAVPIRRCGPAHKNQKCLDADCCNAVGYCGVGTNFCSVPDNCQTAFGRCDSEMFPEGASTLKDPRPKLGNLPYGQAIMDCRVPGTIAMTFDDGPSEYTGELLDKLRAAGAKATFFVGANNNGRQIDQGPVWAALIRRMVDEGHQVGSHTWSHPHMDNITTEERKLEMTKTERAIANIINRYPTYMRPPYSQCDTPGCRQDMIGMGYNVIGCLVDTEDWRHVRNFTASVEVVKERFRSFNSMPFSIICQHDIIQDSVRVLTPVVLDQIKAKGLKAVTVGECLGENDASWYRKPGSGLSWKASDRLGH